LKSGLYILGFESINGGCDEYIDNRL
jgi:hypothetical protein